MERKSKLAVKVLVQAVVVARAISEEKRRRAKLTSRMAEANELFMIWRIAGAKAHALVPVVGNRKQTCVKRCPQVGDDIRKGIGEIFVLAFSKTVPIHNNLAAKEVVVGIKGRDGLTLFLRQNTFQHCISSLVEPGRGRGPISQGDSGVCRSRRESRLKIHLGFSRSSNARLSSTPQR